MKPADPDGKPFGRPWIVASMSIGAGSLADLLAAAVAAAVPDDGPRVHVTCDVDPRLAAAASPPLLREAIGPLVAAAVAAAGRPRARSDFPVFHEVVVTAVDTGEAVEIEIADSAGDPGGERHATAIPSATTTAVARMGGSVDVQSCPEGGRAVTLRIPHRRVRGLAA